MTEQEKDNLKTSLTIEQVFEFCEDFGGEPQMSSDGTFFISKTICHNAAGEGSHKLYYYDNTKLFFCYTDCGDRFDIYELLLKIKHLNGEYKTVTTREGISRRDWILPEAIDFIARYFNYIADEEFNKFSDNELPDWKIFEKYTEEIKEKKVVELAIYDKSILSFLPRPHILPWIKEGIAEEVMNDYNISYNPVNHAIVIPHYDIDNNLVGVRERTLIRENEKNGKYKPAILNYKMYNHPLRFNLYNLNNSKNNIKQIKKAIIWEGEKSCLLYASYFGKENDITVACCGSSLSDYQVQLLLSLGVEEIIIGFDKQFQEPGDKEWIKWTKKLKDLYIKYNKYCQISFLFDNKKLLGYKESPIDEGPEVFMQLFKERIFL